MANETSKPTPQSIPIEKIHDLPGLKNPTQPDMSYGGLVSSIQSKGIQEPLVLRLREDGEYQLVTGYRRRRAAELAKLKEVPALVYDMSEKEALDYRSKAVLKPETPIPGKLVEKQAPAKEPTKDPKEEKKEQTKESVAEKPAETPKPPEKPKTAETPKPTEKPKSAEVPKEEKPKVPAVEEAEKKSADKPKTAEVSKEEKPKVPAAEEAEKKPVEKPTVDKEKVPKDAKTEKKAAEAVAAGPAAVGPSGTIITAVLENKLAPPTEKDLKALPQPKEDEAFSVMLHPGYLEKADYNNFSVDRNSDDFKELYKSIENFGVREPVLATPGKNGKLQIVSGQRRHLIASELNYPVPTIIQKMDPDDARILVADSNIHRERISSYDLSRALRMKADSMKKKAGRHKKGDMTGPKLDTDEALAKEMGMSTSKLNRLMKLSEATQDVCNLVDEGAIQLSIAYNLAFLKPKEQDMAAHLVNLGYKLSNENTNTLKNITKKESVTEQKMRDILDGRYPPKPVIQQPPKVEPKPVAPAAHTSNATATNGIMSTEQGPKPVTPTVAPAAPAAPATPPMAPKELPKSPDVAPMQQPGVVPFPGAAAVKAEETLDGKQERPYMTKVILTGDRLRRYFPDVTMTPREIEDSVYDALEERRQRQEKMKQKNDIFKGKKDPVR